MVYYEDVDIIIRDVCMKDVIQLFTWWIDEEINKYDPRPMPTDTVSLKKECQWYCTMFADEVMNDNPDLNIYKYFIIADVNDNPIGFINLFGFSEELKEAELGIVIGNKAYWNKGIAFKSYRVVLDYAFNVLKLRRIHIETGAINFAALGLFNKLGFQKCDESFEEGGFTWIIMKLISD